MSRGKKNPLTWQDPSKQQSGQQKALCTGEHAWLLRGVKGETEFLECRNCDATMRRERETA